jgi:hypothetical protein
VRPTPCTWRRGGRVSWLSLKTKVDGFSLVWASKPMAMVCEWFDLKTTRMVFTGLASKPVATVFSSLASKLMMMVSPGLASKPTDGLFLALKPRSTVCEWFGLKTTWTVFTGLASKPVAIVSFGLVSKPAVMVSSGLTSKLVATVLSSLASKLVATVSPGLVSKSAVGFLVEPQNQGGGGFPNLSLKTGNFGLVIWASKSSRRFLCLGLKTKWASVCRLCHKTDGGRSARDTRRDLAACFVWKQVLLGVPSLA